MKIEERKCEYCKESYTPAGNQQRACDVCRNHLASITNQVDTDIKRYAKFGTYSYVGKGGSTSGY